MKRRTAKAGPRGFLASMKKIALAGAVLLAVLIPVSAFSYLYFSNSVFPLEDVSFYGNKNLSNAELTDLLAVRKGQNLLRLSRGELAERLFKSPWIKKAAVRKSYSEGRLFVKVEEREPFVLLRERGTLWIADIQGRPLEALEAPAAPSMSETPAGAAQSPAVVAPSPAGATQLAQPPAGVAPPPFLPIIEADLDGHYDTFKEAIIFARLLKGRGYFQTPLIINAEGPPEDLSMRLGPEKKTPEEGGGLLVRVGFGDYEQKLEKLDELKSEIVRRGIRASAIDLRFANRVVVSPIEEVSK